MSKQKPSQQLKERMVQEAVHAAAKFKRGKYAGHDELLIDLIAGGIKKLCKEFDEDYYQNFIRGVFGTVVLRNIIDSKGAPLSSVRESRK